MAKNPKQKSNSSNSNLNTLENQVSDQDNQNPQSEQTDTEQAPGFDEQGQDTTQDAGAGDTTNQGAPAAQEGDTASGEQAALTETPAQEPATTTGTEQISESFSLGTQDSSSTAAEPQTTAEAPEAPQAPVVTELTDEIKYTIGELQLRATYSPEAISMFSAVVNTGDINAIAVIQELDNFNYNTHRSRTLTAGQFATLQLSIFRAIQTLINDLQGNTQSVTLAAFLKAVDETGEYGTLSGVGVFRYGDLTRLGVDDRQAYVSVWNAFHQLAPIKGRDKILKFADLKKLHKGSSFSEEGVQRLIAFAEGNNI